MGSQNVAIPADALQLSWQDIETLAVELSDKIIASGQTVDRLVVLPRGGLGPANIVARRLDIPGHQVLSAALSSYASGEFQRSKEFKVGQFPTRQQIAGKRLLVVDEVCDTGHTLAETVRLLRELGAEEVVTAVLHYKPNRSETGYVPDFYVAQTDAWIVYPWEWHEQSLRTSTEAELPEPLLTPVPEAA